MKSKRRATLAWLRRYLTTSRHFGSQPLDGIARSVLECVRLDSALEFGNQDEVERALKAVTSAEGSDE